MSATTYRQLLAYNPAFRRLWIGDLVSMLGDWFGLLALYAAVQALTDSKLALAGVLIGKTLPIFLMAPIAGPIVDRFDKRKLMIAADLARAVLVVGLIAAHQLGSLSLLYAVIFVQVCFAGLFIPAHSAVVPQITKPDELALAVSLGGGSWSVMLAFGAALGGAATHALGVEGALVIDGLTYLVSAWVLRGLPPLPPGGEADAKRGFTDGLRYLRDAPWVRWLFVIKPAMAVRSGALVMLPVFGNGTFPTHAGPVFIGLLYAARGLGALVGSVGTRRLTGDGSRALRRTVPLGFVISGTMMIALANAPTFPLAMVAVFAAAVGLGTTWVFSATLMQRATGAAFRGRVFALEWGAMTLVSAIGSASAGVAGDRFGFDERQIVGAIGAYLLCFAVFWPLAAWRHAPE